jgi:pyridoxine 4-dehydrogenase
MRVSHMEPERSRALLRRALELGVNLIDTADVYARGESELRIADALHPYPDDLVIATKGGQVAVEGEPRPNGRPEHLRAACEGSLRRLRLETVDLYQLHNPDPDVPLAESLGTLEDLRGEGKVRRIGVSNFFRGQLASALSEVDVISVQNQFSLTVRVSEPELEECARRGIAFLPYLPLAGGALADGDGELRSIADSHGAMPAQVAIAWLLQRSPAVVPIPGTCSTEHLEQNVGAAALRLTDGELDRLSRIDEGDAG